MSEETPCGSWWVGLHLRGQEAEFYRVLHSKEEEHARRLSRLAERFLKGPRRDERGLLKEK